MPDDIIRSRRLLSKVRDCNHETEIAQLKKLISQAELQITVASTLVNENKELRRAITVLKEQVMVWQDKYANKYRGTTGAYDRRLLNGGEVPTMEDIDDLD